MITFRKKLPVPNVLDLVVQAFFVSFNVRLVLVQEKQIQHPVVTVEERGKQSSYFGRLIVLFVKEKVFVLQKSFHVINVRDLELLLILLLDTAPTLRLKQNMKHIIMNRMWSAQFVLDREKLNSHTIPVCIILGQNAHLVAVPAKFIYESLFPFRIHIQQIQVGQIQVNSDPKPTLVAHVVEQR